MADTPIIIKKKKAHGGHGHHGGSWKVAYADFVTAMMAFFMVMWIMGLSDETRAQIQGYFNDPLGFIKNHPKVKFSVSPPGSPTASKGMGAGHGNEPAKIDEKELREVEKKIEEKAKSDSELASLLKHVEMTVTPEGLRIELVESTVATFFASGRAEILPSAKKFLARIGPLIAQTKRPVIIEGHTDAAPYPSDSYNNWDLSADRANAMRRALQEFGLPYSQIAGVSGKADTALKNPSKPFDVSNRRVSLLLPFKKPKDSTKDLPRDEFEERLKGPGKVDLKPEQPQ
ncbi:MAG: OmpA family protein [Fimbriimonadaceae bacterium]|nr:OmpA family protein [Fimbriimonadaceae bacterium]